MILQLIRYGLRKQSTLGILFIDDEFACYTLEDESRQIKLAGETCIPAGTYRLNLRTEGEQNKRYTQKFPQIHKGMLHVCDVPNFKYIHIHIGNTTADTEGCILLGDGVNNNSIQNGFIRNSTNAYKRIYPRIAHAIETGEEVWISIMDDLLQNRTHSKPMKAKVIADRLNLRIVPHGDIEGVLTEGTEVNVIECENDWCKVRVEGWVAEGYLEGEGVGLKI